MKENQMYFHLFCCVCVCVCAALITLNDDDDEVNCKLMHTPDFIIHSLSNYFHISSLMLPTGNITKNSIQLHY